MGRTRETLGETLSFRKKKEFPPDPFRKKTA